MDGLGWDDSQVLADTSPLWSNPQHASPWWNNQENEESFNILSKMDLTEDIFNQFQDLQKVNSNSHEKGK